VDGNELHALKPDFDHPVDGVHTPTTDPDNFNDGEIVLYGHRPCPSHTCALIYGPVTQPFKGLTLTLYSRINVMSTCHSDDVTWPKPPHRCDTPVNVRSALFAGGRAGRRADVVITGVHGIKQR